MTTVFRLRDGWHAMWRGVVCAASFNCKGAAQGWIDTCESAGKARA